MWDVITFVALEHMADTTQHMGLGWGVITSLRLNIWLMLRNTWGWVGWGGVGCDHIRCT